MTRHFLLHISRDDDSGWSIPDACIVAVDDAFLARLHRLRDLAESIGREEEDFLGATFWDYTPSYFITDGQGPEATPLEDVLHSRLMEVIDTADGCKGISPEDAQEILDGVETANAAPGLDYSILHVTRRGAYWSMRPKHVDHVVASYTVLWEEIL